MSTTLYIAFGVVIFLILIAITNATNKLLMKIYENKKLLEEIKNDLQVIESKYLRD
jgi:hypothetical protein